MAIHLGFSQDNLFRGTNNRPFYSLNLVPWPTSECEAEVDLVLIQTFFDLLWILSLKNTILHKIKNNLIHIRRQEGLYQNKVISSLASIHNCKMAASPNVPAPHPNVPKDEVTVSLSIFIVYEIM